uniref:Uncharacterized protein n=1 Tax=Bursaphelenchus xylophilus TaxID=6326 RepID=A0A1I7ST43_BURXY
MLNLILVNPLQHPQPKHRQRRSGPLIRRCGNVLLGHISKICENCVKGQTRSARALKRVITDKITDACCRQRCSDDELRERVCC